MKRDTWDSIKVGDTIVTRAGNFKVASVESYYKNAEDQRQGKRTVIRLENSRHESMMFGHYLLEGAQLKKGDS